jgi:hypothetical protein
MHEIFPENFRNPALRPLGRDVPVPFQSTRQYMSIIIYFVISQWYSIGTALTKILNLLYYMYYIRMRLSSERSW